MRSRHHAAALAGSFVVLLSCPVYAQFRLVPQQQINFSPPGARALGVGGAFTALADDATAAESNPAGLVILNRPELAAHLRVATYETEIPNDIEGGEVASFSDSVWSPSFASFVLPVRPVALSIYYDESSKFKAHSFFQGIGRVPVVKDQVAVSRSETDLTLSRLGFAMAVRLHSAVSIGGSAKLARGRRISSERLLTPAGQTERFLRIDDEDYDVSFSGGLLLNVGRKLAAGFVFKQGNQFEIEAETGERTGAIERVTRLVLTRQLPDVYGGGVALRLTSRVTLMADVLRITYSSLNAPLPTVSVVRLEPLKDAIEVHAGAEGVVFSGQTPLSVRAGFYTDPDHEIFSEVDSDDVHGTLGFGFVIERKFQIDLAANVSKNTRELQVSTVYRF